MVRRVGALALLWAGCTEVSVPFGTAAPVGIPTPSDGRTVAAHVVALPTACLDEAGPGWTRRVSSSPPSRADNWLWGGGLVAADLLSDTLLDLVAPAEPLAQAYQGTQFDTFPEDACLEPFDLTYGTGGSIADVDDDGLLDLYLTRFDRPNRLLHNNGDFTFSDITDAAGVGAIGASLASTWADVDRDGDLDLFVGGYGAVRSYADRGRGPSTGAHLYLNRGDGTFDDRSADLPARVHQAWATGAAWVDINRDLWPDLYVVADTGDFTGNVLLINEGGTLVEDGNRHGLDLVMAATGLAVDDLDDDGLPDFVIAESGNLRVLRSEVGYWRDVSAEIGVKPDASRGQFDPWGVDLGDVDNDGDLDLVSAFGTTHPDAADARFDQPDALFLQGEDGVFHDDATRWAVDDRGTGRGAVLADLNNDGWLDLAKRELDGPNLLYTSNCAVEPGWLRIQLVQPLTNSYGVGAQLEITAGGRTWRRSVGSATGFASAGPPEVHLGLGPVQQVDAIRVIWPDGAESIVQDIPAHAVLRLIRDEI